MISINRSINRQKNRFTERFIDGQVCLNNEHGSSSNLGLFENVSTTTIEHTIDTTNGL
jgi:hypothetical protein